MNCSNVNVVLRTNVCHQNVPHAKMVIYSAIHALYGV